MTTAPRRSAPRRSASQRIASHRVASRRDTTQHNASRQYYVPIIVIARAALARGPLVEHRILGSGKQPVFWKFGHRLFASKTIRTLIAAGEARRVGTEVRAAIRKLEGR